MMMRVAATAEVNQRIKRSQVMEHPRYFPIRLRRFFPNIIHDFLFEFAEEEEERQEETQT